MDNLGELIELLIELKINGPAKVEMSIQPWRQHEADYQHEKEVTELVEKIDAFGRGELP